MLTPRQLSHDFNNFCTGKACDDCCIYKLREECIQRFSVYIRCDIIWFVYMVLAERNLLYKNPNNLEEHITEEDLQELAVDITKAWRTNSTPIELPDNPFNEYVGSSNCNFCPQRAKCNKLTTSCRLNFALTNYKHLFDKIRHAATLRETC